MLKCLSPSDLADKADVDTVSEIISPLSFWHENRIIHAAIVGNKIFFFHCYIILIEEEINLLKLSAEYSLFSGMRQGDSRA